ncbi:4Fe-4S dicluster domain-containing protein [Tepidibacter mesophilus]|uniref:4Fe-4S dicluster domain-containing protein n=1 Tax=Tepidibacter mesophilus TaxID=655607 RepID=UPI000C07C8F4|nr:4Fe-4S dicluster domain-containing protein [Tepidibacter mesophilus]
MLLNLIMKKISLDNNLEIENLKCINNKNKFLDCRKCIDSCTQGAIEIKNKKISIKKSLCKGCGVCSTVCPTKALYIEMKENEKKYVFLKEKKKNIITIGCRYSNFYTDLRYQCLNGIRKEYLAALILYFRESIINIYRGKCSECSNGCFKEEDLILIVDDILNFFGSMNIHINVVYDEKNKKKNIKKYSRRDFLKIVKKSSSKAVINVRNQGIQYINSREIKFEPKKIISKAIKDSKGYIIKTDMFTNFEVSDKCTMCGVCVAMCSCKAWKKEDSENKIFLLHSTLRCTGCGLCIKSCPYNSIMKNDFINNVLIKNEYNCKKEFNIGICQICCDKFTKFKSEDKLCEICKRKLNRKND